MSRGGMGTQEAAGHNLGWDSPKLEEWLNLSVRGRGEGMEILKPQQPWDLLSHLPTMTEISSGFSGDIFSFSFLLRDAYVQMHLFACLFFYWMLFTIIDVFVSAISLGQSNKKDINVILHKYYISHIPMLSDLLDWVLYPSAFLECNGSYHANGILQYMKINLKLVPKCVVSCRNI